MSKSYISAAFIIIFAMMAACQKNFLDQKPDKSLLVPVTLTDFQELLDNSNAVMNKVPFLSAVATDDVYTTEAGLINQGTNIQNAYLWQPDILKGATDPDWNLAYQQVFYANIVLDGLQKVTVNTENQNQYNQIKGTALFYRAYAFYEIAQQYAAPYQPATAAQLPGIPIRLSSDVNEVSRRGTLAATYAQITSDLEQAATLLPVQTGYKTRPSNAAATGMLARVYQTMEDYSKAKAAAEAALLANNKLIDYNTLDTSAAHPLPQVLPNGNDEVSFYAVLNFNTFLSASASLTSVDFTLYQSYSLNDLRRSVFFHNKGDNLVLFKGSYASNASEFGGIANDELYLISAECNARIGNTAAALLDLNALLITRWKSGTFKAYTANNASEALKLILSERRKELVFRNLRWTDLRRLNHDSQYAVSLIRKINGQTYTLLPNDNRYTFFIPSNVIASSGMAQNPR